MSERHTNREPCLFENHRPVAVVDPIQPGDIDAHLGWREPSEEAASPCCNPAACPHLRPILLRALAAVPEFLVRPDDRRHVAQAALTPSLICLRAVAAAWVLCPGALGDPSLPELAGSVGVSKQALSFEAVKFQKHFGIKIARSAPAQRIASLRIKPNRTSEKPTWPPSSRRAVLIEALRGFERALALPDIVQFFGRRPPWIDRVPCHRSPHYQQRLFWPKDLIAALEFLDGDK